MAVFELFQNRRGVFRRPRRRYTPSGYVLRRKGGQQQAQESKPIFELYLLHGQIRYRLDLPAEEIQLDMTKRSLGIEDFAQAAIYQTRCEMEPLAGLLPMDCVSVESANELAKTIQEMPDGDLLKYLASCRWSSQRTSPAPCASRWSWMTMSGSPREPVNMDSLYSSGLERMRS